jgi:hypothetical protein
MRQRLVDAAFDRLKANLERYGNILSPKHAAALRSILEGMADVALGRRQGRLAYPLFAGGGKSQAIIAFIATVHALGMDDVSAAVCTQRVESLCDIKRDLIDNGVPSEKIGLKHTLRFNPELAAAYLSGEADHLNNGFSSEPSDTDEELDSRQFILVTHQMAKAKRGLIRINRHRKPSGELAERSLVCWDESLLKSRGVSLQNSKVWRALDTLQRYPGNKMTPEVEAFFDECRAILNAEERRQRQERAKGRFPEPKTVRLPSRTPEELEDYNGRVCSENKRAPINDVTKDIRELIAISQFDIRLLDAGSEEGGIISFSILIPEDLKNVIILDASHNVRELIALDSTITKAGSECDDVVSYSRVRVHQVSAKGGRASIEKAFKEDDAELVRELVDIVKEIPEDEGVILFTFKKGEDGKDIDTRAELAKRLAKAGVDLRAKVETSLGPKPRFVWMTHGNETSVSRFSYCRNEVWVGVLHREKNSIAAEMAGQQENIEAALDDLDRVIASEVCYAYHQGFCRCSARVVKNGVAEAANIWVVIKNKKTEGWIRDTLTRTMTGLNWTMWNAKHLSAKGKTAQLAWEIGYALKFYEEQALQRVSLRGLKAHVERKPDLISINKSREKVTFSPQSFKRARNMALKNNPNWTLEGQSLVFKGADYYGFKPD